MMRGLRTFALPVAAVVCAALLPSVPAHARLTRGVAVSSVKLYASQAAAEKQKGNQADADTLYSKLIRVGMEGLQDSPNDPELHFYVGKAYCARGNAEEAGKHFTAADQALTALGDKADKKVKANVEGERFNCWVIYRNPAVEAFAEGQKLMNGATTAADTAKFVADFDKSIEYFKKALIIDPTKTDVYPNIAFAYIFTNRKDEGRNILKQAVATSPDSNLVKNLVAVDVDIAQTVMETDADRSIMLLTEADSLDKTTVGPLFRIANIYATRANKAKEGTPEKEAANAKAIAAYEQLVSRFPDDLYANLHGKELDSEQQLYKDAIYNIGVSYYTMKKFPEAEAWSMKALHLDPKDGNLWNLHRASLAGQKKMDRATQDYLVAQAFEKGKAAEDAGGRAAKGTLDMPAVKSARGVPSEIYYYTDDQTKSAIETWFYWKDGIAVTFVGGKKLNESPIPKLAS
jgi:tetratricopeptide (TPR) repeat protein